MKKRPAYILILFLVFGYIVLQFMAWEIMFVRKTGEIAELRQKLTEVSVSDPDQIEREVAQIHAKKKNQVIMIVGEGTVFLLLLLIGVYKIKGAMDREKELSVQQKNFFLSITHELRTPLSAIKLQLQTLQKHTLEQPKKEELLQSALSETERLNALIENILLASRFESGKYTLNKEETDLGALTEATLRRYFGREMDKGEVVLAVQGKHVMPLDRTAFPSVIINLVSNALKYSPEEKRVNVEIGKEGNLLVLRVSDKGIGITDADKARIFDRFFRGGNEEIRKTKGTGLGLYITDYLVKGHGGKIQVRDQNPAGTIFEIRFHA